ncbi:hypothetical protein IFR04_002899 [Cadophora malorum]|uniref:Heterokaryon incompatibility domain-containing protein n=1 Tax=Cadophora malorum TaxID=108018 RepID=A0A8H7WFL0_9HELO|nr:hypothetical protein IFR04_002899 [Cadophora malorum]
MQHESCNLASTARRLPPTRPLWLIDTLDLCLVPGDIEHEYIALSYVWGIEPFFQTTKANIAELQLYQTFEKCHERFGIPKTIEDAIMLVSLTDQRYLWVDALCIVQDDSCTKVDQINSMGSIFGGAYLTIVARQGPDANYGLRGLKGISLPRNIVQEEFSLNDECLIIKSRKPDMTPNSWSRRGWTFQEALFSSRLLIFADDRVWWKCSCCSFSEDIAPKIKSESERGGVSRQSTCFALPFPLFLDFADLVLDFGDRDFTHPQDTLDAFTSIVTALTKVFYGGFVCGIPALFFDIGLCWLPAAWKTCNRKVPTNHIDATEATLPSWSWIGWKGKIDKNSWLSGDDYMNLHVKAATYQTSRITTPLVEWSSRAPGKDISTPIRAPWNLHSIRTSALQQNATYQPPSGWQGIDNDLNLSQKRREEYLRFYYKHESNSVVRFKHPIPLCNGTEDLLPSHRDTLLCCRTQKAIFQFDADVDTSLASRAPHPNNVLLICTNRAWAGILTLHHKVRDRLFSCDLSNEEAAQKPSTGELVAISTGCAIEGQGACDMDEWEHPDRPKGPEGSKYEFYNVLWVEWKDGIAYRKGCGRVMKSAWEDEEREWIDLVLG